MARASCNSLSPFLFPPPRSQIILHNPAAPFAKIHNPFSDNARRDASQHLVLLNTTSFPLSINAREMTTKNKSYLSSALDDVVLKQRASHLPKKIAAANSSRRPRKCEKASPALTRSAQPVSNAHAKVINSFVRVSIGGVRSKRRVSTIYLYRVCAYIKRTERAGWKKRRE